MDLNLGSWKTPRPWFFHVLTQLRSGLYHSWALTVTGRLWPLIQEGCVPAQGISLSRLQRCLTNPSPLFPSSQVSAVSPQVPSCVTMSVFLGTGTWTLPCTQNRLTSNSLLAGQTHGRWMEGAFGGRTGRGKLRAGGQTRQVLQEGPRGWPRAGWAGRLQDSGHVSIHHCSFYFLSICIFDCLRLSISLFVMNL